MLKKTEAPITVLVFGNQRKAPVQWLERYDHLAPGVDFYFLSDDGTLERLTS